MAIKYIFSTAIALQFCIASAAVAQSQDQKNIIKRAITLIMVSKWCKDYVVDLDRIVPGLEYFNVNLALEPYKTYFNEQAIYFERGIGENGVGRFCDAAFKDFRPDGPLHGYMMRR